ncbi:MAG TPA: hypothetical protein VFV87_07770, partial [Pirellulaceae bacterium]|nr:hypothetical protein [Pirellulaceae bacterium]
MPSVLIAATLLFNAPPAGVSGAGTSALPPIVALVVSPDGQHVLAGSQVGIQILSLPSLRPAEGVAKIDTGLAQVHDLAFSPGGKLLAMAGGAPAEEGSVELWDWPAVDKRTTIAAGGDVAYAVAWSPDGSRLAIAGGDHQLRIQPVDGSPAKSYAIHSAPILATGWLAGDDDLVLSAGVDQAIRVLDPAGGQVRRSLDNHTAAVRGLAVRPGKHDGPPMVASAGADRTVRFWQPAIGRLVRFA